MNDEFERIWKGDVVAKCKVGYHHGIYLERLMKTTKTSIRIAGLWAEI
jgi:hypothetical protein